MRKLSPKQLILIIAYIMIFSTLYAQTTKKQIKTMRPQKDSVDYKLKWISRNFSDAEIIDMYNKKRKSHAKRTH